MAEPSRQDFSTYGRLLGYLRGRQWYFVAAIIGYILAAYSEVVFAQTLGVIVDVFNPAAANSSAMSGGDLLPPLPVIALKLEWPFWLIFPVLIGSAALVRAFGSIVGEYLLANVSLNLIHRVRCDLFNRLLALPVSYFDRNSLGSISNRLTDTTQKLRDTATEVLRILLQDGFKLIVLVVMLIDLSGRLTLLFAITLPFVWLIVRIASKRFRTTSENIQTSMGEVTQVGNEVVAGHKLIRSFGAQGHERERFRVASDANRRQNIRMVATKAISSQTIQMIVGIVLGVLMGLLFLPEISAGMTTGDLVAYIAMAGVLVQPVKRLSDLNARIQSGLAAADEIFAQIDQPEERDAGSYEVNTVRGEVEFRNVSFGYDRSDEDVLSQFSFRVEPGQTLAIVGASGSGKSTLVELLMGFYEPHDGEILVDGVPTKDYTKRNLRKHLALVSQDIFLFNDSLYANIAYGDLRDVSREQINDALARANVRRFVDSLPHGLDTAVGDRGTTLSRGQRQRIAIARALLKDAPILILDEATSALDPESEALVQTALNEAVQGRTTIVVAHRLSTIVHADQILVVADGHIAESGTHLELLSQKGRYAKLFETADGESESQTPRPVTTERFISPTTMQPDPATNKLVNAWYGENRWVKALKPMASLHYALARSRRRRLVANAWIPPVPLIVVGNISVGGTGKTPLVIWLAEWLKSIGKRVGIVSRGYKGKGPFPAFVQPDSDIVMVGDEAPVIAERTKCVMVVDPDRVRGVQSVLESIDIDVVISDDGMQHYGLGRHFELAVIDGARGLGNGLLLPAGPLREPEARLNEVDWVISNGANAHGVPFVDDIMHVVPTEFVNVYTGERLAVESFREQTDNVIHAYAAIGNPSRFINSLRKLGFSPISHEFPDHSLFREADIQHHVDDVIVVTEKDWRKVLPLRFQSENVWYMEVTVMFERDVDARLHKLFASKQAALAA
ncbi:MAG: lipid A export permease/ATP-binding protein MsbA [Gammaproteobacteria bacterium]|nr:lipid A export permease/ATP-binding protein MsbA [Gammaproteobacteria bacterium]